MSGETDGRASLPSNAGSVASGYSARTAASTYATEALSAQEKHELIELILHRRATGTLRETRMLARRLDECQRTEAVLIQFQLATSAMEEMIDSAIDGGARGSLGASNEMELLQEIQRLELKVRDAEEYALEKSVRCQDAEALRQEVENAVLKMSVRCEEAKKMRSECEHVLKLGAEQDERIALLQAEIAGMQKDAWRARLMMPRTSQGISERRFRTCRQSTSKHVKAPAHFNLAWSPSTEFTSPWVARMKGISSVVLRDCRNWRRVNSLSRNVSLPSSARAWRKCEMS